MSSSSKYFQARLNSLLRSKDASSWAYPRVQAISYDQCLFRILPENSEVISSNLFENKESNFHVRLSFLEQYTIWEGVVPRSRAHDGFLVYYSPVSKLGASQLCIRMYESPQQRLRVLVQDIPSAWKDGEQQQFLLEAELSNNDGDDQAKLHASFDNGVLTLDVWVPPDRVGKDYPADTCTC